MTTPPPPAPPRPPVNRSAKKAIAQDQRADGQTHRHRRGPGAVADHRDQPDRRRRPTHPGRGAAGLHRARRNQHLLGRDRRHPAHLGRRVGAVRGRRSPRRPAHRDLPASLEKHPMDHRFLPHHPDHRPAAPRAPAVRPHLPDGNHDDRAGRDLAAAHPIDVRGQAGRTTAQVGGQGVPDLHHWTASATCGHPACPCMSSPVCGWPRRWPC